jgi:hypothetical protein
MDIPENIRRALGLAYQILLDLPEQLRPESDAADMQQLLEGKSTGDTGRDGLIIASGVATALAWRTLAGIQSEVPGPAQRANAGA